MNHIRSMVMSLALTAALILLLLASPSPLPAQEQVKDPAAHEYIVRAITLAVTVQDSRGRFVNNLLEDDFTIYENNVKKPLTYFSHDFGAPLSLTVLLDVSGSMALLDRLDECKVALGNLARRILRARDEIALLIFADGQVQVAAKHSTDKAEFLRVLERTEAYGQTALHDAVAVSPEFATRARNEKRALLLITDGIDNDSQTTVEEALEIARRVDVPIYVIGYKIPRTEMLLRMHKRAASLTTDGIVDSLDRFARATGGKSYYADEFSALEDILWEIRREQSHQYMIGYTSYRDTEDIYRIIRVTTPSHKHSVRTRLGY